MKYIPILINAAVLIYGGVVDFKRREIPNLVPVMLLLTGIAFSFSTFWSILGLVAPAVLLFAAAKLTNSEVPGGDFKLLCSLGFSCGLRELAAVIFLAGIGAVVYGLIKRLPVKRHIPLCSYVAPSYIALQIIAFALERG
jgi:prepilin signal peptidase PulO-like enzyme (type II secretory pathway)